MGGMPWGAPGTWDDDSLSCLPSVRATGGAVPHGEPPGDVRRRADPTGYPLGGDGGVVATLYPVGRRPAWLRLEPVPLDGRSADCATASGVPDRSPN